LIDAKAAKDEEKIAKSLVLKEENKQRRAELREGLLLSFIIINIVFIINITAILLLLLL